MLSYHLIPALQEPVKIDCVLKAKPHSMDCLIELNLPVWWKVAGSLSTMSFHVDLTRLRKNVLPGKRDVSETPNIASAVSLHLLAEPNHKVLYRFLNCLP